MRETEEDKKKVSNEILKEVLNEELSEELINLFKTETNRTVLEKIITEYDSYIITNKDFRLLSLEDQYANMQRIISKNTDNKADNEVRNALCQDSKLMNELVQKIKLFHCQKGSNNIVNYFSEDILERYTAAKKNEDLELRKIIDAYDHHFTHNIEDFGKKLFQGQWNDINDNKDAKKIVERGFKVLQKAYPNEDIDDDLLKVKNNQHFKDFLKVCAIVLTLGLAALSEKTTLQSTKKKNFNSFKELVEKNKKNPQHQK